MATEFIDEVPSFEIKDGIVTYVLPCGVRRCTPLRLFRITHQRAAKALAEYDAAKGEVVPIKRRRRGHAASP